MSTGFTYEEPRHDYAPSGDLVEKTGDEKQFFERINDIGRGLSNLPRDILRDIRELAEPKSFESEHAFGNDHVVDAADALAPALKSILLHVEQILSQGDEKTKEKLLSRLSTEEDTARVLDFLKQSLKQSGSFAFVGHAQQLDRDSETDQALDVVFDTMDDAFLDGNFSFVDDALERFNIGKCSVALLVGILTVTGPARSKLTKRKKFRDLVETSFRDRGRYDERLLRGL